MGTLWDFPIKQYREQYGLTVLVETGMERGRSVLAAIDAGFDRIVTCDLSRDWFDKLVQSRSFQNVEFFEGPSLQCLPQMLKRVEGERALMWLDAHVDPDQFSTGLSVQKSPDVLPLPKELELIRSARDCRHDVIVVDDLHLYVEQYWIATRGLPPGVRPVWKTADEIAKLFPSHRAEVAQPHDYALVLRPKGAV